MSCFFNRFRRKRDGGKCKKDEKNPNQSKHPFVEVETEQPEQTEENVTVPNNTPMLRDGLQIKPAISFKVKDNTNGVYITGAHAFYNGTKVFTVNELGMELLGMADGMTTVDEMIVKLDLYEQRSDVGMFFVALGQAGYLKNRFEIKLYETENIAEGYTDI